MRAEQNIHGLEHRIAKQTKWHGVNVGVARHVFERGHAFEARHGDEHFKEQIQLIGLRNRRLDKDRADIRVNANGEIVQHGFFDVGWNLFDVLRLGLGRERVQIRDDEEGFVLVLQAHTILQRADVVTEMQASCGAVTGEEAGFGCHGLFPFVTFHMSLRGRSPEAISSKQEYDCYWEIASLTFGARNDMLTDWSPPSRSLSTSQRLYSRSLEIQWSDPNPRRCLHLPAR